MLALIRNLVQTETASGSESSAEPSSNVPKVIINKLPSPPRQDGVVLNKPPISQPINSNYALEK